jgi:hypothetical protein
VRLPLILALLAVPGLAWWTLLRGLDPVGRLVVAVAAALVVVAGTAQVMLMAGAWSPTGGLVAVLVVSAALVAVARRPGRARTPSRPVPAARPEDDEWIYER